MFSFSFYKRESTFISTTSDGKHEKARILRLNINIWKIENVEFTLVVHNTREEKKKKE